jgi:phosphopantothenoylcysteine decarboxylase/phosphopantothenate--cysteine ligase
MPPPSALRKGCDWIVANDVSPATGIMGGAENAVC